MELTRPSDEPIIEQLFKFYSEDFRKAAVSGLTGAPMKLPRAAWGKAQLLNLALYRPEFALVWGGPIAFSQLDTYRSYLAKSKRRFAIIADGMKGKMASDLALNKVPVYIRDADFDPVKYLGVASSLDCMIYVSHKSDNYRYISANRNIIHAYGGHGYSDKHTAEFRLATAYDFIFRSDHQATLRFHASAIQLDPRRFLLVGGCPVEGIVFRSGESAFQKLLYAPTWEGHSDDASFTSVPEIRPRLEEYAGGGGDIFYRPHPGLGSRKSELRKISKSLSSKFPGSAPKAKTFNASDFILADISGIIPEYLFTGMPIVIPVRAGSWKDQYLTRTDLGSYCYIWHPESEPLMDFIETIRHDPLKERRLARRFELFLGSTTTDELCQHFERALEFIIQARYQLQLKSTAALKHNRMVDGLFRRMPEGSALRTVVEGVMQGSYILGMQ